RTGTDSRIVSGESLNSSPILSPDGDTVVFSSNRGTPVDLYRKVLNGDNEEKNITRTLPGLTKTATDYSANGKYILFHNFTLESKRDIWILHVESNRAFPFVQTASDERSAQFSPTLHWIAYSSNESGDYEIYVASFLSQSLNSAALSPSLQWGISR